MSCIIVMMFCIMSAALFASSSGVAKRSALVVKVVMSCAICFLNSPMASSSLIVFSSAPLFLSVSDASCFSFLSCSGVFFLVFPGLFGSSSSSFWFVRVFAAWVFSCSALFSVVPLPLVRFLAAAWVASFSILYWVKSWSVSMYPAFLPP